VCWEPSLHLEYKKVSSAELAEVVVGVKIAEAQPLAFGERAEVRMRLCAESSRRLRETAD